MEALMRFAILALLTGSLAGQSLTVPCEPSAETLHRLEDLPALRDDAVPYEQRIGALRALAKANPGDFFLQRAYQDAFRHQSHLADEFDRALAMYRKRGDDLGRYLEVRLLLYSNPKSSRATLEQLLKEHPEFAWPHLEFVELGTMPGSRAGSETAPPRNAFVAACPDAYVAGVRGFTPDAVVLRRAIERRNSRLDLSAMALRGTAEDRAGVPLQERQRRVLADVARVEALPLRNDPE